MRALNPHRAMLLAVLVLALGAALVAGCGGGDGGEGDSGDGALPLVESRPAPPPGEFPSPGGRSMLQLLDSTQGAAGMTGPLLANVFSTGGTRVPFLLLTVPGRNQASDADVALYITKAPEVILPDPPPPGVDRELNRLQRERYRAYKKRFFGGRAQVRTVDRPATGPFPARLVSLATEPEFRSETTSQGPEVARSFYVADVDFPRPGKWILGAVIKRNGETTSFLMGGVTVRGFGRIPEPGERAPRIETPTRGSVSQLSELTTRVPPEDMNRESLAAVLGRKPAVVVFASPGYCQSRLCLPVVDVAEQVKARTGNNVEFIHMEIFNDNDPSKGVRAQVRRYHLPVEPWTFVIAADGRVTTSFQGPVGVDELERAVRQVEGGAG